MASAEQPSVRRVFIGGTESHSLTSRSGARYRIDVGVPWGKVERPPVLYLLDGDASFPGACASLRTMLFDNIVPPLLIVGIAQLGEPRERAALRVRDFTTEEGVLGFLRVLTEEVLPFVEARYEVDTARRRACSWLSRWSVVRSCRPLTRAGSPP